MERLFLGKCGCLARSARRLVRDDTGVAMMTYVVFAVLLVAAIVAAVIVFGGRQRSSFEVAGHAAGGNLKTAEETAKEAAENFEVSMAKAMETGKAIQGGEFPGADDGDSSSGGNNKEKGTDDDEEELDAPTRVLIGEAEPQYSAWKSFWEGFIVGDNYELYGDDMYRYRGGWMVAGQFVNMVSIGAVQKVEYGITWATTHWGDKEAREYGLDKAKDGAIQLAIELATAGAIHGAGKVFSKMTKGGGKVIGETGELAGDLSKQGGKTAENGKVVDLNKYRETRTQTIKEPIYAKDGTTGKYKIVGYRDVPVKNTRVNGDGSRNGNNPLANNNNNTGYNGEPVTEVSRVEPPPKVTYKDGSKGKYDPNAVQKGGGKKNPNTDVNPKQSSNPDVNNQSSQNKVTSLEEWKLKHTNEKYPKAQEYNHYNNSKTASKQYGKQAGPKNDNGKKLDTDNPTP